MGGQVALFFIPWFFTDINGDMAAEWRSITQIRAYFSIFQCSTVNLKYKVHWKSERLCPFIQLTRNRKKFPLTFIIGTKKSVPLSLMSVSLIFEVYRISICCTISTDFILSKVATHIKKRTVMFFQCLRGRQKWFGAIKRYVSELSGLNLNVETKNALIEQIAGSC